MSVLNLRSDLNVKGQIVIDPATGNATVLGVSDILDLVSANGTYGSAAAIRINDAASLITLNQDTSITGSFTVSTISAGISDYDRFLVSDGGLVRYRTGAQVLSDIGAQASGNYLLDTTDTFTGILTIVGDITQYEAVNDANPSWSLGSSATERLEIISNYVAASQSLDYVNFKTYTASATAHRGRFRFSVDEVDVFDIFDAGIYLAANKQILGTDSGGTDRSLFYLDGSNVLHVLNNALGTGGEIRFRSQSGGGTSASIFSDGSIQFNEYGGGTITGTLAYPLGVTSAGDLIEMTTVDADTLDTFDSSQFLRSDVADTKTSGDLRFYNSVLATFGTTDGLDMDIYHNSADAYIKVNHGRLFIDMYEDDLIIRDATTTRFTFGRTTGDLDITGVMEADGYNSVVADNPNIDTHLPAYFWEGRVTTTDAGTQPDNYCHVVNLGGNPTAGNGHGTQLASSYGSDDAGFWIRRRSDNAGSENGANVWQNWKKLALLPGTGYSGGTLPYYQEISTSDSDPATWYKIYDGGASLEKIHLHIQSPGDNGDGHDDFIVTLAGYSFEHHLQHNGGGRYNTAILTDIRTTKPTDTTPQIWIKLAAITTGNTIKIWCSHDMATASSGTPDEATSSDDLAHLELTSTIRDNFTYMCDRGIHVQDRRASSNGSYFIGGGAGTYIARFIRDVGSGADAQVAISGKNGYPSIHFDQDLTTNVNTIGFVGNTFTIADSGSDGLTSPYSFRVNTSNDYVYVGNDGTRNSQIIMYGSTVSQPLQIVSGGTYATMAHANHININASYISFNDESSTLVGRFETDGDFAVEHALVLNTNAEYLWGKTSGGSLTRIHGINASDVEYIGSVDQNVTNTILGTTTDSMEIRTDSTTAIKIDANQNVSIGDADATPDAKLHVKKNSTNALGDTAGSTELLRVFQSRGSTTTNEVYNRVWAVRDVTGTSWTTWRQHDAISIDASFGTPGTDTKTFWERDPSAGIQYFGNAAKYTLTINGSGNNVGVNETNPQALLHVKADDGVEGQIKIEGGKSTVTSIGEVNSSLLFGSNDGSVNGTGIGVNQIAGKIASITESTNGALVGMAFYTFNQSRPDTEELEEAVRITNAGNVGIGKTDPSYKLDVAGNVRIGVTASPTTLYFAPNGGTDPYISYVDGTGFVVSNQTADSFVIQDAATEIFRVNNDGDVTADGEFIGFDRTRKNITDDATTTHTVANADAGICRRFTSSSSITVTVDTGSLANIGDTAEVDQYGTGLVTIAAGTATLRVNANATLVSSGQYSRISIQKMTSTEYRVFGELEPA